MIVHQLLFIARSWLRTPFRLFTLLFGIGLAVALQHSMQMMNRTTNSSFQKSVREISGDSDLVLQAGKSGVPEESLAAIQNVPGVRSTVPLIIQRAFAPMPGVARLSPVTILGVDLLNESAMRSYGGNGRRLVKDPMLFMSQVDSIAVTQRLAELTGVKMDDKLQLATSKGMRPFTVRAIIQGEGVENTLNGVFAVMDIETARVQFGKEGKYDQVDIKLYDPLKTSEVAREISKIGNGFNARPPSQQLEVLKGTVAPVQSIFDFFGSASLIIAFFLVLNTAQTLASEKVYEIGLQRALGSTRSQIFFLGLLQFACLGLGGSLFGILFAEVLTSYLVPSAAHATIQEILALTGTTTLVVVIASSRSAMKSARISPVEAFRTRATPEDSALSSRARFLVCAALVALATPVALVAWAPEAAKMLAFGTPAANACLAVGLLLAAPFLCLQVLRGARFQLASLFPHRMIMAIDSILIRPVNSVRVFKTLSFGFILVFTIHFIRFAFEDAIDSKFHKSDRPDFVVTLNGTASDGSGVPMDEGVLSQIAGVPGVIASVGQRFMQIDLEGKVIQVTAVDKVPEALTTTPYSYLDILDTDPRTTGDALFGPLQEVAIPILVNRGFGALFGKKTGDHVHIRTPSGEKVFAIIGTVGDVSGTGGAIYLARPVFRELWRDPTVSVAAVRIRSGESPDTVRKRLHEVLPLKEGYLVSSERELREQIHSTLDGSLKMLELTQVLTLVIALVGFASAFTVSIQSRVRELGLMRSLGLSKNDVFKVSFLEVNFTTLSALLISVLAAIVLAKYFLDLTLAPTLGWSLSFKLDPLSIAKLSLVIFAITILAAANAMIWAIRAPIREALKTE